MRPLLNIVRNRPVFAQYAITHACNSRCPSCSYWTKGSSNKLGIDEVKHLADELWAFGVRIITLTGGEPFMRRDTLDIIRLFSRRGFRVTINTNGILLDKAMIGQLASIPDLHIVVSLDSLDEGTYSLLRGVNSLKQVLGALSSLKRYTPHEIRVFTLVSGYNYREVPQILDFCKEKGYHISLYPVMTGKRGRWFTSNRMIHSGQDTKEIAALFEELAKRSKRDRHLFGFSSIYRGAARFLRGEPMGKCGAGEVLLQISPDGKVSACPEMEPFCDIRKERLEDAYLREGWRRAVKRCYTETPCYIGCTRTLQSICNSPLRFFAETALKMLRR